ncbi:DUF2301 domain-containing membrane protein [Histophilus somni]|uniref:DUF2301 domain-containing membrane protein n=1 Tax=Histophilus somni TaxID=731 RepID=UPI00109D1C2E|nr:DUF2301 domain-containing membrane protein [Histophilus somni]QEH18022.1 hypothetical protein FWK48_05305 [Histophilus somni]THA22484.1 hypothetical protein E5361_01110 [Histophilus somni]
MADPQIKSPMDHWDYLTVILYRCGFTLAAIMTALLPYKPEIAHYGILIAATLCASSLHIYLKNIRLLLQMATWVALICQLFNLPEFALGGALLTLGGLAFKEYFCFRVFALNLQPFFVATLWLSLQFNLTYMVYILSVVSAVLFLIVSLQKWRMPLHFDIGDKRKYQL